jgi:hypothetical protein
MMFSPSGTAIRSRGREAESTLRSEAGRLGYRAGELERGADATRGAALRAVMDFDPEKFMSPEGLNALVASSVPAFHAEMAGAQAMNERRGIRGPAAGAREGDVRVAFDRNTKGTAATWAAQRAALVLQRNQALADRADADSELAFATRGQGLDLVAGQADRETAERMAARAERQARRRALGAGLGTIFGSAAGFMVGGPQGAAIGGNVGGQAGAGFYG